MATVRKLAARVMALVLTGLTLAGIVQVAAVAPASASERPTAVDPHFKDLDAVLQLRTNDGTQRLAPSPSDSRPRATSGTLNVDSLLGRYRRTTSEYNLLSTNGKWLVEQDGRLAATGTARDQAARFSVEFTGCYLVSTATGWRPMVMRDGALGASPTATTCFAYPAPPAVRVDSAPMREPLAASDVLKALLISPETKISKIPAGSQAIWTDNLRLNTNQYFSSVSNLNSRTRQLVQENVNTAKDWLSPTYENKLIEFNLEKMLLGMVTAITNFIPGGVGGVADFGFQTAYSLATTGAPSAQEFVTGKSSWLAGDSTNKLMTTTAKLRTEIGIKFDGYERNISQIRDFIKKDPRRMVQIGDIPTWDDEDRVYTAAAKSWKLETWQRLLPVRGALANIHHEKPAWLCLPDPANTSKHGGDTDMATGLYGFYQHRVRNDRQLVAATLTKGCGFDEEWRSFGIGLDNDTYKDEAQTIVADHNDPAPLPAGIHDLLFGHNEELGQLGLSPRTVACDWGLRVKVRGSGDAKMENPCLMKAGDDANNQSKYGYRQPVLWAPEWSATTPTPNRAQPANLLQNRGCAGARQSTGSTPIDINFLNLRSDAVDVYWVGWTINPQTGTNLYHYKTLNKGDRWLVHTGVGHDWVVKTRSTGACVGTYRPLTVNDAGVRQVNGTNVGSAVIGA